MILSYTVFPVLFKRYSYNALDCAIPTTRCVIRHGDNKLGRTSIRKVFIFKDAGQFNPISWDRGDLEQPTFFRALKYNNFSLLSHSQVHCFLDCDFHHNDIRFTFFLIFLMLLTLNRKTYKSTIYFSVSSFLTIAVNVSIATWVYSILISLSGDVQLNPGTKNKFDVNFSICHQNLNSIAAHNYAKVFLLKAYIAVYKFDIICISETYLDSSITSDDDNLEILGYKLIRSDHPSN